jgi:hypothetical protein
MHIGMRQSERFVTSASDRTTPTGRPSMLGVCVGHETLWAGLPISLMRHQEPLLGPVR